MAPAVSWLRVNSNVKSKARLVAGLGPGADTAWLSWLRVVAICSVISIHTVAPNAVLHDVRHSLRGWVAIVLDLGSGYAVPVFVMMSGAMMLDPNRFTTTKDFLRKRVVRLVPAIIFWNIAYAWLHNAVSPPRLTLYQVVGHALSGTLFGHLYFFWIILGLSLVAPVLVPFTRENSRAAVIWVGLAFCAIPVMMFATQRLRGSFVPFSENAFTWWIPYLGFFILGYGLRGVVLRGGALVLSVAVSVSMVALSAWQWLNPDAATLTQYSPLKYYSASWTLFAIAVYLAFQGLIAPAGPLRSLCRPTAVRVGRLLGDATLGVYGLHFIVLIGARELGVGGTRGDAWMAATSTHRELLLLGVVTLVTWMAVLSLRRVPLIRRVL